MIAVLLAVLGAGTFLFGRVIDDFTLSVVLQGLRFVLVAAAGLAYARRTPGLLRPVAGDARGVCRARLAGVLLDDHPR